MRIGIDVRYLSHGLVGGVHTYVHNVVRSLLEIGSEHAFYLYGDTKRPFEMSDVPAHATVRLLPWRSPLSSLQHDLFMGQRMAADHLDVAHFPANYGFGPPEARTVLTVHDAINLFPLVEILRGHAKNPRTMGIMTYLHLCTTAAVRRASLLVTVSRYARQQITHYSGYPTERILVVPHAPTPDVRRIKDPDILASVRRRYDLAGMFVLADALKNPAVLVRAWRLLPAKTRQGRRIVFFARRPEVRSIVHEAVARGEAILLARPSREELIALYSLAEAFVFPSWMEGFGIPLLEAMVCGAPVIASDRGAIPEVLNGAGRIGGAEDVRALAGHLEQVLTDPDEAKRMRERGFARAAEFSWRTTARQMLAGYAAVLSPAGARSHEVARE
jgi:glycosyltransferase involved in cell wall biosynthesis